MKQLIGDLDTLLYKAGFAAETTKRIVTLDGKPFGDFPSFKEMTDALLQEGIRLSTRGFVDPEDEKRIVVKKEHHVEPESKAVKIADQLLSTLLDKFSGWTPVLYLQGKSDWRYDIWPIYKHSRANIPKPVHFDAIVKHYKKKFNAIVPDMEADDACSVLAYECMRNQDDYIVMSVDKDLDQIPGDHFNYNWFFEDKDGFYNVDPWDAEVFLYAQILSGDKTDDIPGIKGIGDIKAKKFVEGCKDHEELFWAVYQQYLDNYGYDALEVMTMNANLVYLVRKPNEYWSPPIPLDDITGVRS